MSKKRIIRIICGVVLLAALIGGFILAGKNQSISKPDDTPTPDPTPSATATATPEPTPEPTPTATPEPTPSYPNVDISSWEYVIANADNSIGDYEPVVTAMENGQFFDSRASDALAEFIEAARAEGLSVYLSSTYRTYSTQSYLYKNKVSQYGEEVAKTIVAPPGTSEHQLGLAADITDRYYQFKDESLEDTELYKWMSTHCAEYGFIVRYPKDKTEESGIIYEPWHFRYVGVEVATYIMENGLILEEFVALYEN